MIRRSTELDLPYPDLQEYIADMNVMMALIINGPVWVTRFPACIGLSVYSCVPAATDLSVSLQEVVLLPTAAVSELQVSDARPA